MKISACLVIRNEEKLLSRCLDSLKDIVDEIIIVHDGLCSDKSLEIAKKYKARVFVRPFVGVAEPHRPFSFSKASGEWILQIDADEFLSAKAQKEIPKLILTESIDAYSFSWPYSINGRYISQGPFSKTLKHCFLRKSKMFMVGIAQEYPRTYGVLAKRQNILLEHKPSDDNFTRDSFENKWVKWAKLQARQIYEIEKASTFNIPSVVVEKSFSYYAFMRRHPILSGIKETIKFIMIYISRGILWSGWSSMRIAYFELSYLWLVRINLEKLKYGKNL